jgi:hypothetical protein
MVPWPQRAPGEARIAPATGGAHCSAALPIPRSASQAKPGARSERRAPRVRGKLPCLGPRARARGAEPCAFGARRGSALTRAPRDTSEHGWALSHWWAKRRDFELASDCARARHGARQRPLSARLPALRNTHAGDADAGSTPWPPRPRGEKNAGQGPRPCRARSTWPPAYLGELRTTRRELAAFFPERSGARYDKNAR